MKIKIRITTGRPKRKSGVYPKRLEWGYHSATHQRKEGVAVDLRILQVYQREEGPTLFDGLDFKVIPV